VPPFLRRCISQSISIRELKLPILPVIRTQSISQSISIRELKQAENRANSTRV